MFHPLIGLWPNFWGSAIFGGALLTFARVIWEMIRITWERLGKRPPWWLRWCPKHHHPLLVCGYCYGEYKHMREEGSNEIRGLQERPQSGD